MPPSDARAVLDASAILAVVLREPGREVIVRLSGTVLVSTVNLAEVRSKLVDLGYEMRAIDLSLALLPMQIVDFDEAQATVSGEIRFRTEKMRVCRWVTGRVWRSR